MLARVAKPLISQHLRDNPNKAPASLKLVNPSTTALSTITGSYPNNDNCWKPIFPTPITGSYLIFHLLEATPCTTDIVA